MTSQSSSRHSQRARSVGLILRNANVITMNPRRPRAQAVAIKGDRIVWVGDGSDLEMLRGPGTKAIDCGGRTVIPGFIDAHCHIMALASTLVEVDCSPAAVSSIEGIKAAIRRQAEKQPSGTWIRAQGYNEFYLAEKRHPNRGDLDAAAPYHCIRLTHRTRRAAVLNSLALQRAGISIESSDPPGGLIDRDLDSGEPTGLLYGMNAYLSEEVVPPLSEDELERAVRLAGRQLLSLGITSVQDATESNGWEQWRLFHSLKEAGVIWPRIWMMAGVKALPQFREAGLGPGAGDERLHLGAVKIAIDETHGYLNPSPEELNRMALQAHNAGYQVAFHAVEETTVSAAASAIEYAWGQHPRNDHRHRVEHCSVCPPPLLRRLRAAGALVVTQPPFIYYSGERYLAEVAPEQLPWLYRIGSLVRGGIRVAASSDAPVAQPNPLVGIYAAVTRKAETGQLLNPQDGVTPLQALKMYTAAAAYAARENGEKGSIAPGKLADLVVLSGDPTTINVDAIKDVAADITILGGEVVGEL